MLLSCSPVASAPEGTPKQLHTQNSKHEENEEVETENICKHVQGVTKTQCGKVGQEMRTLEYTTKVERQGNGAQETA